MTQARLMTCSYSKFKPDMGTAVRTSLGGPKWWNEPPEAAIWVITPRREYLRMPYPEYRARYLDQLDRVGPGAIEREFRKIGQQFGYRPLVLLCFEKLVTPDDWCHRSMFAEWWLGETGETVTELAHPRNTPEAPAVHQPPLF